MKLEPPVPAFKRVAASTSALTPRHAINSSNSSSTQFKQPIVGTNMAKPQCKKKQQHFNEIRYFKVWKIIPIQCLVEIVMFTWPKYDPLSKNLT
jgi:hypothetical protein